MATENSAKAGNGMARPPEGFKRLGSVTNAPWFSLKEGNILYGVLENVYARPDERAPKTKDGKMGSSKFFQVKLLEGCEVRTGRGEDAKVARANPGDVVNLNYGPKTKALEPLCPQILQGAEYHVWIKVLKKFKISAGRTMWDLDQNVVCKRPPAASDEPDFVDSEEASA